MLILPNLICVNISSYLKPTTTQKLENTQQDAPARQEEQ